jgi:hypothetical protein
MRAHNRDLSTIKQDPKAQAYYFAMDGIGFFAMENLEPLSEERHASKAYVLVDDPKKMRK